MDWPKIRTSKLNLSDDLSGPLIILAGIILSMWTNFAFVACITEFFDGVGAYASVGVGFQSHFIICYFSTVLLIQGFAKKNANLLKPWLILKGIEILFLFIGIIVQSFSWRPAVPIIPVAAITLLLASCLENLMYEAWKYIKENPDPPPSSAVTIETVMAEKPPSYDSFTNQNVM